MDPVSLALGAMVLALVGMKTWGTARTEHELAKNGTVPPRMEAKYGQQAAAAKVARYGFLDFLRDAWNDYWPRRTDALIAARNAKAANPGQKTSWRDRFAAAKTVIAATVQKVAAHPAVRKVVDPVGGRLAPTAPVLDPPPLAVDTGDVPEGTRRWTATGTEEMHDGQWRPVPNQPDAPPAPAKGTAPVPAPQAPSTGGPMTAPTGEATNYHSTVAELDAMNRQLAQMMDAVQAGMIATKQAADHLDGVEGQRRPLAVAAISTKEHLEALHLDPATMIGVDTACEALAPNAVAAILATLESAEEQLRQILAALEAAQAGVAASKLNVVNTYGGAADVVDQTGIDSKFLDSDATPGGSNAGPVRNDDGQPVGSPQLQRAREAAGEAPTAAGYDRTMADHGYTRT